MDIQPETIKSDAAPTDTPPARVALSKISASKCYPCIILVTRTAPRQLPVKLKTVLTMHLSWAPALAKAPLKEGQYIHRKMVPTKAIRFES